MSDTLTITLAGPAAFVQWHGAFAVAARVAVAKPSVMCVEQAR
jgi:hypothetical protein